MNVDAYKNRLIEFALHLNKPFDSVISSNNFHNNVCEFLGENYQVYLSASTDEQKNIRKIIKEHNRNDIVEGDPLSGPLSSILWQYSSRARRQLETSGNDIWLIRGLVAISILDGIHYRPDDEIQLARLFVVAEEKGLNPRPVFQLISELSSNEPTELGEISTSRLIATTPNTAHQTVDEFNKWFDVDKENE